MSKTGTVKSWSKSFGFAEMANGTLVYIHQTEIDGGKLRVGHKVSFDTEKVEGHGDRVKGTNVTGEAVLKKDQKLSEEELAADKKLKADARDARKAEYETELEPVIAKLDDVGPGVKLMLLKKLAKDLKLDEKYTLKKPETSAETRPDPTAPKSKKSYTKAEFIGFYGKKNGDRMWILSGRKAAKAKKTKE